MTVKMDPKSPFSLDQVLQPPLQHTNYGVTVNELQATKQHYLEQQAKATNSALSHMSNKQAKIAPR